LSFVICSHFYFRFIPISYRGFKKIFLIFLTSSFKITLLGLKLCDFFYFLFYKVIISCGLVKLTLVDLSFFSIFVFMLLRSFLLGFFFIFILYHNSRASQGNLVWLILYIYIYIYIYILIFVFGSRLVGFRPWSLWFFVLFLWE